MKLICFGDSWTSEREYNEGGFHPNLLGYKIISDFIYNKIGFQTN